MRVLVVDDEPIARRRLIRMLDKIDGVVVAGEAHDGIDARDKIAALEPDVVLLDIHMPRLGGMSMVKSMTDVPPIIFTTAYDHHAVEAFEACAVDYLMKPIKQARLEQALMKVNSQGADVTQLMRLVERLVPEQPNSTDHRIVANDGDAMRVFDVREIGRFHASDKYSVFHSQGKEYLLEESLHGLEQRLQAFDFIRVHRAELICLNHVVALRHDSSGAVVELRDGQTARVSRRHLTSLKRALRVD